MTESMLRMTQWYNGLQDHITNSPKYEKISFLYPEKIDDIREARAICGQHFKAVNSIFRNLSGPVEHAIIKAIDEYNKDVYNVSDKILGAGKAVESRADQMNRLGHTVLPKLSAKKFRICAIISIPPVAMPDRLIPITKITNYLAPRNCVIAKKIPRAIQPKPSRFARM